MGCPSASSVADGKTASELALVKAGVWMHASRQAATEFLVSLKRLPYLRLSCQGGGLDSTSLRLCILAGPGTWACNIDETQSRVGLRMSPVQQHAEKIAGRAPNPSWAARVGRHMRLRASQPSIFRSFLSHSNKVGCYRSHDTLGRLQTQFLQCDGEETLRLTEVCSHPQTCGISARARGKQRREVRQGCCSLFHTSAAKLIWTPRGAVLFLVLAPQGAAVLICRYVVPASRNHISTL